MELKAVDSVDPATVWRTLEKNELEPWLKQQWVVPLKASAAFVAAMDDVSEVYARLHDPTRPVVCVDEGGEQLIGEVREPLPVRAPALAPSKATATSAAGWLTSSCASSRWAGARRVAVIRRRRSVDFARFLKAASDVHHADARRIVLICDDLSARTPAVLHEAFEPAGTRTGWPSGSSGTTRLRAGAGSTWPRSS